MSSVTFTIHACDTVGRHYPNEDAYLIINRYLKLDSFFGKLLRMVRQEVHMFRPQVNVTLYFCVPHEHLADVLRAVHEVMHHPMVQKYQPTFQVRTNNFETSQSDAASARLAQAPPESMPELRLWRSPFDLRAWRPWPQASEGFFATSGDSLLRIQQAVWPTHGEPYIMAKVLSGGTWSPPVRFFTRTLNNDWHFVGAHSCDVTALLLQHDQFVQAVRQAVHPRICPLRPLVEDISEGAVGTGFVSMKRSAHVVLRRERDGCFQFLLQHRPRQRWSKHLSDKKAMHAGQNVWGLPGGGAHLSSDVYPEVTAWRECVEECLPEDLPLDTFMAAIVQRVPTSPVHVLFVVDADALGLPPEWEGPSDARKEVCSLVVTTGHQWVDETFLDSMLFRRHRLHDIPMWPLCVRTLTQVRPALGWKRTVTLFHGTSLANLGSLLADGFRQVDDRKCEALSWKCSPEFQACCCAGMMGNGVYLAHYDKALSNSGRLASHEEDGVSTGVVLKCQVDLGECKVAPTVKFKDYAHMCACGCSTWFTDHLSKWSTQQRFDSVYVPPCSVSKRPEFCVKARGAVRIVAYQQVKWQQKYTHLMSSSWTSTAPKNK